MDQAQGGRFLKAVHRLDTMQETEVETWLRVILWSTYEVGVHQYF